MLNEVLGVPRFISPSVYHSFIPKIIKGWKMEGKRVR